MGYVALTPQQFSGLEEAAKANKQIESVTITGDYTGVVTTNDVTIDYQYDPLKQILNFNIGAKHSLAAKIAGDNVISNHIVALIHGLNYPAPAPAATESAPIPEATEISNPVPAPTEEPEPAPAPDPVPTAPIDSVTV